MTNKILNFNALIIIVFVFSSFNSCQDKSREELILGKWRMDEKEYGQAQMSLEFKKDKSSIVNRIVNGKSTLRQLFNYKLIDNQKYLLLTPIDKEEKTWKVEVLKVDTTSLTLRSQSPDSSLLVLKKLKE